MFIEGDNTNRLKKDLVVAVFKFFQLLWSLYTQL